MYEMVIISGLFSTLDRKDFGKKDLFIRKNDNFDVFQSNKRILDKSI